MIPQTALGLIANTNRGFERIDFRDANNIPCSLQQSSAILAATESAFDEPGSSAIWLGRDREMPPHLTRMHLNREQVAALIDSLQRWLETGSFMEKPA